MANHYSASVPASQVGSYFVQQYYQMFRQQREFVHQFYNESSSMMRIDGEISDAASDMMQIHQLIMSLSFTGIKIKTINSLESWGGGILVVVSGSVESRNFSGSRKFVQTFFLAPQEKGYFVLNDMFHFADEELLGQHSVTVAQELSVDYQPTMSTHHPDPSVSDYQLEEEASVYLNSVHIGDRGEPVQDYSYHDQRQYDHVPEHYPEPEPEPEPELEAVVEHESQPEHEDDLVEEEIPFQDSSALLQNSVTTMQEPRPSAEEPLGEPEKLTYASILRAKGKSPPPVSSTAFSQKTPAASDWNYPSQHSLPQPAASDWDYPSQPSLPQSAPSPLYSGADTVEESLSIEEGESMSVYVRNLPSTVTSHEIFEEFKNFGQIKHDGVFLRNRQDTGVCYAFVEFEDVQSVHNALKASPIQLAGRQVYIEERRPNTGASRGGRSGRGGRSRGGGRGRGFGRSASNGSDNRVRTNGFRT